MMKHILALLLIAALTASAPCLALEEANADGALIFVNPTNAPADNVVASASLECRTTPDVMINVELAANSIYDTTLCGGDVFSFNDVVGPRTESAGYVKATNGRGAEVVGGGVAQVASVLWLAIKDFEDISIVSKSTYGSKYNQNYVSSSADAILTDYNADIDFAFRYDGAGSITLYTWVEDGVLLCSIDRS